jgi:hypothetical protein
VAAAAVEVNSDGEDARRSNTQYQITDTAYESTAILVTIPKTKFQQHHSTAHQYAFERKQFTEASPKTNQNTTEARASTISRSSSKL